MLKRVAKALTVAILVLTFLAPFISVYSVANAATTGDSTSTAGGTDPNSTTRSMLSYFRDSQTNLSVDHVARDEVLVYGVFMSNFFVPWSTKVRDITDVDKANSIPKAMSVKFFGSEGKATQMRDLNKKLEDPILAGLGSSSRDFALYVSPNATSGAKPITGIEFLKKIAGGYTSKDASKKDVVNKFLYNSNNVAVIDLGNKATQAAFQVVFGLNPEYMVSGSKGMSQITSLHMDGLGNIWGAYDKADFKDYVLILPAALNPVTFSKSLYDTKLPVANVFVMGGIVDASGDYLLNTSKGLNIPYYNINAFPKSSRSASNMMSIFGVNSPSSYIGNSNELIKNGGNVSQDSIKNFTSTLIKDTINMSEGNILLSLDGTKAPELTHALTADGAIVFDKDSTLNRTYKGGVVDYLFQTTAFKLGELADDMYYFKNQNPAVSQAADDKQGSFADDNALMANQRMFTKEVYTTDADGKPIVDTQNFQLYENSYFPSHFTQFLSLYQANTTPETRTNFLTQRFGSISTDVMTALTSFLDSGNFGNANLETVKAVFALLNEKKTSNGLVYKILEPSASLAEVVTKTSPYFFFWKKDSAMHISSFGLTDGDWYTTSLSSGALGTKAKYHVPDSPTFKGVDSGGDITSVSQGTDVSAIAAYFHNFMTYKIFGMNKVFTTDLKGIGVNDVENKFTSPVGGEFKIKTTIMSTVNNYAGIYWGYMRQLLNVHQDNGIWKNDDWSNNLLIYMNIDTIGGGLDLNSILGASGVVSSEQKTLEEMQNDIVKKVYGLLSTGPNDYRDSLIKSAQDSWIISTHRSITGSWVGNVLSVSAGGGGSYASVVGFINTPSLADLPLTSWLLNDYMFVYMIMLLLISIVLILMVLTNIRSLREGLLIFIIMAFVLILPQFLVGNVINISNMTGDKLYSGRFNYWAIVQQQQSFNNLKTAQATSNAGDYTIAKNMEANKNMYTSNAGVMVKWMAPKRDDLFDKMFSSKSVSQSLQSNLTIFRWLFSSVASQQQYIYNDPMAAYLYRPYNAIASDAKDSFDLLYQNRVKPEAIATAITGAKSSVAGLQDSTFSLITHPEGTVKFSTDQKKAIEDAGPYAFGKTGLDRSVFENYRYWSLNNGNVTKSMFRSTYETDHGYIGDTSNPYYKAYSLSTESPFYYFYNALKMRYSGVTDGKSDFKSALLEKNVFAVSGNSDPSVNGKIRDFLDLQGLFTYVVPYLNQGNQYVHGWTSRYGKTVNSFDFNCSTCDPNSASAPPSATASAVPNGTTGAPDSGDALYNTYKQESSKKASLKNVWKLYSPWVDQLYSLDIAGKKVRIADKNVQVDNTLNPGAYDAVGRPMLFSEADMYAKSYRSSDLSDVEMRIQRTLDSTYKDMLYLANYYDFDNEVLLTAAAMQATFNFDREFSNQKLLGESNLIYPQSFELKNFNYDAFMRLIMLNATGESLLADKDLYVRILDKTSLFTGILLILNDLMAVMVIPTVKVLVLLLLLLLSIAISIACVVSPPERIGKVVMKNLLLPSLLFLLATGGFAFVISLFMGEGLTGYVGGRTPSVGVTDPTVTMGLMFIVDCVYLFVLWKIAKLLFSSLKSNVTGTFFSTLAMASGAASSLVSGTLSKLKNGATRGAGFLHRRHQRNKLVNSMGDTQNEASSGGSGSSKGRRGRGGFGSPNAAEPSASDNWRRKDPDFADYLDNMAGARSTDGKGRPVPAGSNPSPTQERTAKHGPRGNGRSASYESTSNPKNSSGGRPSASMSDAQLRRLENRMNRQDQNSAKTFMHLNTGQNRIYSRVKKVEGKVTAVKRIIPKK